MQQLQVEKDQDDGGRTTTELRRLSHDEREQELARMLGGVEITAKTLTYAREMLEKASA
jgi:DNA repair protein RecN (Recombination protein N)